MAYIGQGIKNGTFAVLDTSGNTYNGSNVTFDLGTQVGSPAQLLVSHDGVIQKPVTDYTIATGGTQITFTTAPASGASIFITEISGAVGAPMNRDINGDELILDADADTSITADTDDQIDIKIGGTDVATLTNSNLVLKGTTPTLTIGDAGAEDTKIVFDGNAQDYHIGLDDSSDDLVIGLGSTLGTTSYLNIDEAGKLSTGGEDAPDCDAGGITIDLTANDGKFLTLKSSDFSHGITDHLETDTGFAISKSQAGGGVSMTACNDGANENIWNLTSIMGETNTTATNTTAGGNFTFGVYCKASSGTGTQAVADAGNAWVMRNNNAARLIFKGDGEIHSDTGSTTYDAYDDAQLVRAFDLSHGKGVIESKFDKFIAYNHEKLADLGLVGREEDGTPNHFTNITGMQKLHNGAIWQQYEKHNQLLEAVYDLAKEAVGEEKANAILDKHEVKRLQ